MGYPRHPPPYVNPANHDQFEDEKYDEALKEAAATGSFSAERKDGSSVTLPQGGSRLPSLGGVASNASHFRVIQKKALGKDRDGNPTMHRPTWFFDINGMIAVVSSATAKGIFSPKICAEQLKKVLVLGNEVGVDSHVIVKFRFNKILNAVVSHHPNPTSRDYGKESKAEDVNYGQEGIPHYYLPPKRDNEKEIEYKIEQVVELANAMTLIASALERNSPADTDHLDKLFNQEESDRPGETESDPSGEEESDRPS